MEVLMTHITRKGSESSKRKTIARGQFLRFLAGSVLGAVMLSGTHAWAQGNATAGKTGFENQCASCHSTEPGKQGFGPSLAGVLGRQSCRASPSRPP
jgi:cytochrome c2